MFSTNICTIFVRPLPWWLLFNELMNKACHYLVLFVNCNPIEIVDSGSLKGDRIRSIYTGDRCMQVNLTVYMKGDFWEVVH